MHLALLLNLGICLPLNLDLALFMWPHFLDLLSLISLWILKPETRSWARWNRGNITKSLVYNLRRSDIWIKRYYFRFWSRNYNDYYAFSVPSITYISGNTEAGNEILDSYESGKNNEEFGISLVRIWRLGQKIVFPVPIRGWVWIKYNRLWNAKSFQEWTFHGRLLKSNELVCGVENYLKLSLW